MLTDAPDGCILTLRVHPGARRNGVTGIHNGALKLSLTTPPTDGRANAAVIAFLAERLKLPRARISLLAGASSRSKSIRIEGLTVKQVREALSPDLHG